MKRTVVIKGNRVISKVGARFDAPAEAQKEKIIEKKSKNETVRPAFVIEPVAGDVNLGRRVRPIKEDEVEEN